MTRWPMVVLAVALTGCIGIGGYRRPTIRSGGDVAAALAGSGSTRESASDKLLAQITELDASRHRVEHEAGERLSFLEDGFCFPPQLWGYSQRWIRRGLHL